MTRQDAFDKALAGIRNQGYQRSAFGNQCVMYGPGGTKCAIAHAYTDETEAWLPEFTAAAADETEWSFVKSLRMCHDYGLLCGATAFEMAMSNLADVWQLAYTRQQ